MAWVRPPSFEKRYIRLTFHRFIDFGLEPFIPLWELAASSERRAQLKDALKAYYEAYKPDLGVNGPYLEVRTIKVPSFENIYNVPDGMFLHCFSLQSFH